MGLGRLAERARVLARGRARPTPAAACRAPPCRSGERTVSGTLATLPRPRPRRGVPAPAIRHRGRRRDGPRGRQPPRDRAAKLGASSSSTGAPDCPFFLLRVKRSLNARTSSPKRDVIGVSSVRHFSRSARAASTQFSSGSACSSTSRSKVARAQAPRPTWRSRPSRGLAARSRRRRPTRSADRRPRRRTRARSRSAPQHALARPRRRSRR